MWRNKLRISGMPLRSWGRSASIEKIRSTEGITRRIAVITQQSLGLFPGRSQQESTLRLPAFTIETKHKTSSPKPWRTSSTKSIATTTRKRNQHPPRHPPSKLHSTIPLTLADGISTLTLPIHQWQHPNNPNSEPSNKRRPIPFSILSRVQCGA